MSTETNTYRIVDMGGCFVIEESYQGRVGRTRYFDSRNEAAQFTARKGLQISK